MLKTEATEPTDVWIPGEDIIGHDPTPEDVADFLERARRQRQDSPEDYRYYQELREAFIAFNQAHDTKISIRALVAFARGQADAYEDISSQDLSRLFRVLKTKINWKFEVDHDKLDAFRINLDQNLTQGYVNAFCARVLSVVQQREETKLLEQQATVDTFTETLNALISLPPIEALTDDNPQLVEVARAIVALSPEKRQDFILFLAGKKREDLNLKQDAAVIRQRTSMRQATLAAIYKKDPINLALAKELVYGVLVYTSGPALLASDLVSNDIIKPQALADRFNAFDTEKRRLFKTLFEQTMDQAPFEARLISEGMTLPQAEALVDIVTDKLLLELERAEAALKTADSQAEDGSDAVADTAANNLDPEKYASLAGLAELINGGDSQNLNIVLEIIRRRHPELQTPLIEAIRDTHGLRGVDTIVNFIHGTKAVSTLRQNAEKRALAAFSPRSQKQPTRKAWEILLKACFASKTELIL